LIINLNTIESDYFKQIFTAWIMGNGKDKIC
jgi:hypothetical protein